MNTISLISMIRQGFERGYNALNKKEQSEVREKLHALMHVSTRQCIDRYIHGRTPLPLIYIEGIAEIFSEYGINDSELWGKDYTKR